MVKEAASQMRIRVTVNGKRYQESVDVRWSLADFLREGLGLTGTHLGCEHGVCGACTVLLDGATARSCLMLAVQAEGCEITTVEGLDRAGEYHPVQQAFHEHHGLQCGFCTPGFLLATCELLKERPHPTDEEIRLYLAGNLCRCTGYQQILESVREASRLMEKISPPG